MNAQWKIGSITIKQLKNKQQDTKQPIFFTFREEVGLHI